MSSDWNWHRLCGHGNISVWEHEDFGHCFEQLTFVAFTHLLHAIASSYHFGRHQHRRVRGNIPHIISLHLRFIVCILLVITPIVILGLVFLYEEKHPSLADIITWCIRAVAWLIHSGVIWRLKRWYHVHIRGPKETGFTYLLTCASCIIQLRTVILHMMHDDDTGSFSKVEEYGSIVTNVLHLLYALTCIASKRGTLPSAGLHIQDDEGQRLDGDDDDDDDALLITDSEHGTRLGRAEANVNCLSRLLFCWVLPLMRKGAKGQITSAYDLYQLPTSLKTDKVEERFSQVYQQDEYDRDTTDYTTQDNAPLCHPSVQIRQPATKKLTLLQALNKAFGCQFYSVGILKFFGDSLNFAGPSLLNLLVTFMEHPSLPSWHGYLYAGGLFTSTLLSSLFNTHFNYLIGKVSLKIRAAVITTVYHKAVAINTVNLATFSTGEVVNFMSTDTDRITNFCPSFHAFWSLPIQVCIALWLLYRQVGISFLAGVGFAIILIPINRWLAIKIGQLSTDMMHHKDSRVKLMNEILYGIRVIKFYAWEKHFTDRINIHRTAELKSLKGRKYLDAWCVYFWATTPVLISILTFSTYTLLGHKLTAAKVFTCMALFNILITPLNAFPWVLNGLMEAWVSLKRLQAFCHLTSMDYAAFYTPSRSSEHVISVHDGNFSWQEPNDRPHEEQNDRPHEEEQENSHQAARLQGLSHINMNMKRGSLIGVIGKVGCGKSSLLNAIAGELHLSGGTVSVSGVEAGLGIATQEPWIQHATLRDNVLFGKSYNKMKYEAVIEACALSQDIQMLPAGDMTEIGENGVTLSGGQKARVALARTVYQEKAIYFLDDPLAAVDAHVAQHLYDKCIMGILKNKTRVLCTHHTKYLQQADIVFVMDKGRIVQSGVPSDILSSTELSALHHGTSATNQEQDDKKDDDELLDTEGTLVEEEQMDTGVVKLHIYSVYWQAVGGVLATSVLIALFLMQASRNTADWWLSFWVTHFNDTQNVTDFYYTGTAARIYSSSMLDLVVPRGDDVKFYLTVYGCLAGANSVFTFARAFLFAYGGICAAKVVHQQLLASILKAPISFFDKTPVGRILNRFSSDLYSVDDSLPFVMNILFACLYGLLGTLVITCYGLPWFLVVIPPLAVLYYFLQHYYRYTSREVKRITSITLSPIYAHFSETLQGLAIIRAHRETHRFRQENQLRLDVNQRAQFGGLVSAQWLGLNLQMIGVAMVTAIAFIAVLEHHFHSVNQGLVGLSLSYALSVTGQLNSLVTQFSETEKQMVSVERTNQYTSHIPQENNTAPKQLPPHWPEAGELSFNAVSLQYRPGLPYALDHVSFHSRPAEKIGIVGRTGSGKSSLFLTLFRMVDMQHGTITIDDCDLTHFPLQDLRSRMSIIPQDPFLFAGSVHDNLDPSHAHTAEELWSAVEKCHLDDVIQRVGGLDAQLAERGRSLSTGQRQLLCLARAIITKAKILCIDEATASVDSVTDNVIQQTVRDEFRESTVLTIAHRIHTVMDSDRVMVMKDGKVAEFDAPNVLLEDRHSVFYSLVHGQQTSSVDEETE